MEGEWATPPPTDERNANYSSPQQEHDRDNAVPRPPTHPRDITSRLDIDGGGATYAREPCSSLLGRAEQGIGRAVAPEHDDLFRFKSNFHFRFGGHQVPTLTSVAGHRRAVDSAISRPS